MGSAEAFLALAAATLVSEDLACVGAGLLIARGSITFSFGTIACFAGIVIGDLLLYAAGRAVPRMRRGAQWFERNDAVVILASRFIPGTRLATYVAAGALRTNFRRFALWVLIAVAVWTPLFVGSVAYAGSFSRAAGLAAGALLVIAMKGVSIATDFRKRRLLLSRWRRLTRWEFWPAWLTYLPLIPYLCWLGFRVRNLTAFTAANPLMPAGGVIGESKFAILRAFRGSPEYLPRTSLVESLGDALSVVDAYPVVLKPDAGQRGSGVVVARSASDVVRYFDCARGAVIVQEYVDGPEFGIFYVRHPNQMRGRIISVTEKRMPHITGDGRSTIEELILRDGRAVCMAPLFLRRFAERRDEIPEEGRVVPLVELGTHCRGAMFLDGRWILTPALENAIGEISRSTAGFHFGRFDVRAASIDELRAGRFKILELNGVTSEATHIYDPRVGIVEAYRMLFEQWRIAYEIGAVNRRRGAHTTSIIDLLRRLAAFRRDAVWHEITAATGT